MSASAPMRGTLRRTHPAGYRGSVDPEKTPQPGRSTLQRPTTPSPTSCSRRTSIRGAAEMQHIGSYELPSDAQVEHVIEMCRALLFPGYAGPDVARLDARELRELVRLRVDELRVALHRQVYRALPSQAAAGARQERARVRRLHDARARRITDRFLAPAARAARGDPAGPARRVTRATRPRPASTRSCSRYPGAYAITVFRHRARALREGAVVDPAHDDRARAPPDRHRHPPRRRDRRVVLHRPRHRRRDRRDHA